ncbi:hypothetical protein ACSBR2_039288 [Camellia fascicularis]
MMKLLMRMFLAVLLVMMLFQPSEMSSTCRKVSKGYKAFCPGDRVCNDTCKQEGLNSGFCQLVPKHQVCMCFYSCH